MIGVSDEWEVVEVGRFVEGGGSMDGEFEWVKKRSRGGWLEEGVDEFVEVGEVRGRSKVGGREESRKVGFGGEIEKGESVLGVEEGREVVVEMVRELREGRVDRGGNV